MTPAAARLAGKIALVTGGATGIGRAIVPALAREGAPVAPGLLATGFGGGIITREVLAATGQVTPIGRPVAAEEVADAVVFALANESLTGYTAVVDGGLTALGPTEWPR